MSVAGLVHDYKRLGVQLKTSGSKYVLLQAGRTAMIVMCDKQRAEEQLDVLKVELARARRWFERTAERIEGRIQELMKECEQSLARDDGLIRGKLYYLKKHLEWLELQRSRGERMSKEW